MNSIEITVSPNEIMLNLLNPSNISNISNQLRWNYNGCYLHMDLKQCGDRLNEVVPASAAGEVFQKDPPNVIVRI